MLSCWQPFVRAEGGEDTGGKSGSTAQRLFFSKLCLISGVEEITFYRLAIGLVIDLVCVVPAVVKKKKNTLVPVVWV